MNKVFADGENISANAGITHTTVIFIDAASATTYTSAFSMLKVLLEINSEVYWAAAATGAAEIFKLVCIMFVVIL